MRLEEEDIKEYQHIWKAVFGEEISAAEARDSGNRLIELFLILGEVTTKDEETRAAEFGHPER
jgi:hypothetical protein